MFHGSLKCFWGPCKGSGKSLSGLKFFQKIPEIHEEPGVDPEEFLQDLEPLGHSRVLFH